MTVREAITTERKLHELSCVMDDLTTLAQSNDGLRTISERAAELRAVERKLHDLVLDTQLQAAE